MLRLVPRSGCVGLGEIVLVPRGVALAAPALPTIAGTPCQGERIECLHLLAGAASLGGLDHDQTMTVATDGHLPEPQLASAVVHRWGRRGQLLRPDDWLSSCRAHRVSSGLCR